MPDKFDRASYIKAGILRRVDLSKFAIAESCRLYRQLAASGNQKAGDREIAFLLGSDDKLA
ncbi:MAG: hypothetical protein HC849_21965 [Oscillatoriales cyanobacterium RU_3_3]|nr:hypothetical protein [Oscillatoriales cyanobacterium RU_3_3]NJR22478.1 hypothetical protein [Richelia sp. CSU_2_1]